MPSLTIFSTPKPFTDPHINVIQRNAIQSWIQLGNDVEVLLIGDEPGMDQVTREFGVQKIRDGRRNPSGTPLVSSIFGLAREYSQSPMLAYVNADILLLPNFLSAAKRLVLQNRPFLIVGQRWDLAIQEKLAFKQGWQESLLRDLQARGRLHPPAGSDYFIFPRNSYAEIPDFAIGRAGWDNWMIYHARKNRWLVVDASMSVTVVHQDHDYSHLPGGQPHYKLEESDHNRALAGGKVNMYLLYDANVRLVDGHLVKKQVSLRRILRQLELWFTPAQARPTGVRWSLAKWLRRTWQRGL